MPEDRQIRAEIEALKAALMPPRSTAAAPGDDVSAADAASGAEIVRVLGELHRRLADAAVLADEEITAHPLAAVAAALLLGFVLGRASK